MLKQSTSLVCPLLVFKFAEEFDILLIFLFLNTKLAKDEFFGSSKVEMITAKN